MARKDREPIRVETFVKVGGVDVNTKDLNDEQRRYLARWINETAVRAAYPDCEIVLKTGT